MPSTPPPALFLYAPSTHKSRFSVHDGDPACVIHRLLCAGSCLRCSAYAGVLSVNTCWRGRAEPYRRQPPLSTRL